VNVSALSSLCNVRAQCGVVFVAAVFLFGVAPVAAQDVDANADSSAAASEDAKYSKLVADAVSAFDAGRYRESRELLMQAHQLRPNARTLRGMGLAAFELGRYSLALTDLDGALAETRQPMSPAQRKEVELLRAEANTLIARYVVHGLTPDAELRVDGEAPLWDPNRDLLLDQGSHSVTVVGAGEARSWSVVASGGQHSELDVRPPPPAAEPVAEAAPPPPELLAPIAPANEGSPTGVPNFVAYAAIAAAAVTGGLAIWQWRERESEVDAWNSDSCLKGRRTRRTNCGEHQDAYQRAETWAWVAAGATLALSAGAITLLVLNGREEKQQPMAAGRPICVPGPAAFACRVSF
jgi:tetratricopeptide (TPR) repeat protein